MGSRVSSHDSPRSHVYLCLLGNSLGSVLISRLNPTPTWEFRSWVKYFHSFWSESLNSARYCYWRQLFPFYSGGVFGSSIACGRALIYLTPPTNPMKSAKTGCTWTCQVPLGSNRCEHQRSYTYMWWERVRGVRVFKIASTPPLRLVYYNDLWSKIQKRLHFSSCHWILCGCVHVEWKMIKLK